MGVSARTTVNRLREQRAILSLVAVMASASVAIRVFSLPALSAPSDALSINWIVLAACFAIAERFVVNLHFKSEAGTFSLLELPLIFGLLFAPPVQLWGAVALGTGFSLAILRRQPPVKVVFNVANLTLRASIAMLILSALLGDADPMSPRGWLAVLAAALLSSLIEVQLIGFVIALSEGGRNNARLMSMTIFSTVVAFSNTLQALIAAIVITAEPRAIFLLIGSASMLFAAYRAYVSERDQRERVEFLYDSTRSLRQSEEMSNAVAVLLEEAASMFRASLVELIVFPSPDSDDEALRFLTADGTTVASAVEDDVDRCHAVAEQTATPMLVDMSLASVEVLEHVRSIGVNDALIGTLRSERRPIGLLVIGDRLGSVTSFTIEDLRLFENLVEQSAVALENDQLEQALVRLRELESELSHKASYDHLTGLANRMLFTSQLADVIDRDRPAVGDIHLLYIDLDDFKPVNDRFGHSVGDELLRQVAKRIRNAAGEHNLAARLGGDEFAVLLVDSADPDGVAQRIINDLSAPFTLGEEEVRIGASVGIADDVTGGVDGLVHFADLAMYRAKQRGKGSVVWHSSDLEEAESTTQELHTALRRAIAENEFEAHYQPIIRLADQAIVAAEALVRWRHPNGELLPPAAFLAEAERSGLVIGIDRLIQEAVLSELPSLLSSAPEDFFVSINLSGRHLQQPGYEERFLEWIPEKHRSHIVIEVTESVFLGDAKHASDALSTLQRAGVRIALDDFGTGYSSLAYLRRLPIDYLKIAKTFIDDVGEPTGNIFVQAITTLAHTLELSVIAEGIENESEMEALRSIGCDFGQGFHYARAMPLDELIARVGVERQLPEAA